MQNDLREAFENMDELGKTASPRLAKRPLGLAGIAAQTLAYIDKLAY